MTAEHTTLVLDASAGVKWFKPEAGADEARALLQAHRQRRARIIVTSQFIHEVVSVAVRHSVGTGEEVWAALREADLTVVGLDDTLVTAAFDQCRLLGCSFYDALAPALATLLDATLCSADARAHGGFPGVMLVG